MQITVRRCRRAAERVGKERLSLDYRRQPARLPCERTVPLQPRRVAGVGDRQAESNVSPKIFEEQEPRANALPDLVEALQSGGVNYRLGGKDKESVLRELVETLRLPDEGGP